MVSSDGNQITQIVGLHRKWIIEDQLGSGGFGSVYLAYAEDGSEAVAKFIPKSPGAERELSFEDLNELPNIVPVIDRGEWDNYWVIVMPKADKSLRDFWHENIEHLTLNDTVVILSDIAKALVAIEGQVVHRDIKPQNILLLNGSWCLADFGISRYADATTASDTLKHAKTYPYAAPEQWRGERASSATDVYALGVVAYEMLAGHPPFTGPAVHDYRRQHLEKDVKPIPNISLKLQSLIDECLYKSPEARPRPQNLLARLKESVYHTSAAGRKLQQVNATVVQQRAKQALQQSLEKSREERRIELCVAAEKSLERIVWSLDSKIMADAPVSVRSGPQPPWSWSLKTSRLNVDKLKTTKEQLRESSFGSLPEPPFEIIAFSAVGIDMLASSRVYMGRAHSLWYCDAKEAGEFRWYETAFMFNPLIGKGGNIEPFALSPGQDAYGALAPIIDQAQVAWPFTPIDLGDEDDFVERWIGWFADAAQGNLHHPSHMPEKDPRGSWRRE